ncbi:MAG: hypothetical protein GDA47_01920 [Rhodospirillales bacterium]|nr:hypothetical protein [Rhodospirillales bacterium]
MELTQEIDLVPIGGSINILRQMLYLESLYETVRAGGTEALGERDPLVTSTAAEHLARGANIRDRGGAVVSTDLLLYINGSDNSSGAITCQDLTCTLVSSPSYAAVAPGHFVAGQESDVDVVQSHAGVHLVLDRSGEYGPLEVSGDNHLAFGAWMDDVGFFVAAGSSLNGFLFNNIIDSAQQATVRGEPTGSRPAAAAVWNGSMVGTLRRGDAQNHLLRGGARLRFNMRRSDLYAEFFNIRDYDRFGVKHRIAEVQRGAKNRLRFRRIPVAADGSYARTYDNDRGSIRGAFYGDDHGETAGIFDAFGIVGAFGAKQATN